MRTRIAAKAAQLHRGTWRDLRTEVAWKLSDACMALDRLAWRIAPWDQPASRAQLIDDYYRIGYLMGVESVERDDKIVSLDEAVQ
jgi:hypothetical protein